MKKFTKASLAIAIHNEQERHSMRMLELEKQMINMSTNMRKPLLIVLILKFFWKTFLYFIPFILAADLIYIHFHNAWYDPYIIIENTELFVLYLICLSSFIVTFLYVSRCFKQGRVL